MCKCSKQVSLSRSMTWHPKQTLRQSHDRHWATCSSPSPKWASSIWEQKWRSPFYNLEVYAFYGWALPSPPCTANISVIIPRTKHPPKCSPPLQSPERINNCFYLQWGKKKKIQARLKAWGPGCVFVLKWLPASAGSATLHQQLWQHSQRPEMPPFQKGSFYAAETGSATGHRNTYAWSRHLGGCRQQACSKGLE